MGKRSLIFVEKCTLNYFVHNIHPRNCTGRLALSRHGGGENMLDCMAFSLVILFLKTEQNELDILRTYYFQNPYQYPDAALY